MKKVAVVFWSGTGNTAAMADAVVKGAQAAGADVTKIEASSLDFYFDDAGDALQIRLESVGFRQ